MRRRHSTTALLVLTLLAACTVESHEGDDAGAPPRSRPSSAAQPGADTAGAAMAAQSGAIRDTAGATAARPQMRVDTLLLEGTAEPVELTLVRAPDGFPLPFSTYATSDFIVESTASKGDDDPAVRFIAAFGGVRNDDAFLEVAAYPAGLTEAQATARAERAVGAGGNVVAPEEGSMDWAVRQWRLSTRDPSGGVILGFAALGRHDGRWFHILARYPGEYADGFGPRADLILEHWRWDDGAPLAPPTAP